MRCSDAIKCSDCIYGEQLIDYYQSRDKNEEITIPEICKNCYPHMPKIEVRLKQRKMFIKKINTICKINQKHVQNEGVHDE